MNELVTVNVISAEHAATIVSVEGNPAASDAAFKSVHETATSDPFFSVKSARISGTSQVQF